MIQLGVDLFWHQYAGQVPKNGIAAVTNDAAQDSLGRSFREALQAEGADLRVLFAPEHGLTADLPEGEVFEHGRDSVSGLPVYCAYEEQGAAFSVERLHGADLLLFDLPLVGSRYYTYLHVLDRLLRFASDYGITVWVMDRPNPIRADCFEGGLPQKGLKSMVASVDLPIRYGLTTGEVALFLADQLPGDVDLKIFSMEGYEASMWFDETELPWIAPSPNMLDLETAVLYPGTCLLEGVELNEGRGTAYPFRCFGAPWIDAKLLSETLTPLMHKGIRWETIEYIPQGKARLAGKNSKGLHLHVTDRDSFTPLKFGIDLLWALHEIGGSTFKWTVASEGGFFVDRLMGSSQLREAIDKGRDMNEFWNCLEAEAQIFAKSTKPYWLYSKEGS